MKAHISLQIYPPEEFGYVIGVVSDVSDFPSTPENMMNLLQNRNLVQMFSQKGPPIKVTTQLLRDSATVSGYAWTSSHGPASLISAGTVCGCGIIVREQAPISLIFPYISKELGI